MNKKYTLKKNHDIEALILYKTSVGNKSYAIYYHNFDETRIAVSVSKKLGKAYLRNYLKRVTKEILRPLLPSLNGLHLLVVVKKNATTLSFSEKEKELTNLIKKIKVVKK